MNFLSLCGEIGHRVADLIGISQAAQPTQGRLWAVGSKVAFWEDVAHRWEHGTGPLKENRWPPGPLVPLKGRCEIQERTVLQLAKPNQLHFSEATNEITPSTSVSWRLKILGCQNTTGKKSVPRESGKNTQQRVVFSNACDFPVRVTGALVELGGVP
jgi:hypothetical protein